MRYVKLWVLFAIVTLGSLGVLSYYGVQIWQHQPPIPSAIKTAEGRILFDQQIIHDGQNVWQSIGGQELGSIWGHGSYVAPDWTADYLHRESLYLLQLWAKRDFGAEYAKLNTDQQAQLQNRLKQEIRTNTYNPESGTITLSPDRAQAVEALGRYYGAIFGDALTFPDDVAWLADNQLNPKQLRNAYAIATDTIKTEERKKELNAFFF
jgi:nitric oxide reductase subunit B